MLFSEIIVGFHSVIRSVAQLIQFDHLPYKKKKDRELSASSQKEWNESQSKTRIKVEHAIAQIKKFRISGDVFRNKLCRYDGIARLQYVELLISR